MIEYDRQYRKVLQAVQGLPGMDKQYVIRKFNQAFFNREFYNKPRDKGLGLIFEDNRTFKDPYLEDAIQLCLHTEVDKLGLSLKDLMNMDYPTYTRIAEALTHEKQEKIKQMEKTQQQFQDRSKALAQKHQ